MNGHIDTTVVTGLEVMEASPDQSRSPEVECLSADTWHACMQAIAAVQEKLLNLNSATFCHVSIGKIINMASNDARRFEEWGLFWPYAWAAPIEAVVVLVLVALEVGWLPALAGAYAFTLSLHFFA